MEEPVNQLDIYVTAIQGNFANRLTLEQFQLLEQVPLLLPLLKLEAHNRNPSPKIQLIDGF